MADGIGKIRLRIRLPTAPRAGKRPYKRTAKFYAHHETKTKAQFNALWDHSARPNKALNPSGRRGHKKHMEGDKESFREDAMRRKRLKLSVKKQIALEAHELQQLARENALAAMQTLIEISGNARAPEATRIAASQVILDRGYGKASQMSITANVTNGKNASDITTDELDKRVNAALKRVEDLTNRTGKAGASPKRPSDLRKYN